MYKKASTPDPANHASACVERMVTRQLFFIHPPSLPSRHIFGRAGFFASEQNFKGSFKLGPNLEIRSVTALGLFWQVGPRVPSRVGFYLACGLAQSAFT